MGHTSDKTSSRLHFFFYSFKFKFSLIRDLIFKIEDGNRRGGAGGCYRLHPHLSVRRISGTKTRRGRRGAESERRRRGACAESERRRIDKPEAAKGAAASMQTSQ